VSKEFKLKLKHKLCIIFGMIGCMSSFLLSNVPLFKNSRETFGIICMLFVILVFYGLKPFYEIDGH